METRVTTVTNDGIKRTYHNEWSFKDCFVCVASDVRNIAGNAGFECTSRNYTISSSNGRLSIVDECVDFSIHLDEDEIDLVNITVYDDDNAERKIELYTANAEFHITIWF